MQARSAWQLILSCEHGSNRVPPEYAQLFGAAREVLATHRGYDLGIDPLAGRLAEALGVPLSLAPVTRLLVELNRSPGHPALFSEFSRGLPEKERHRLMERYYYPYRQEVTERIEAIIAAGGAVCHISLHSFTPELNGEVRQTDIGLLYDPRRPPERVFCQRWQSALQHRAPALCVRRNYPYLGRADGLTTALRKRHAATVYLGIELEVNQAIAGQPASAWAELREQLTRSLEAVLVAAPAQVWQTPG